MITMTAANTNRFLKDKNVINDNIDICNLSKGVYLIKITTTNNEIITKKKNIH